MEKYVVPSVKKLETQKIDIVLKKANCSGNNSRKMPIGNFDKKQK
jgi:hypothetical protein